MDWIVRRDGRQFLSVPGVGLPSRAIARDAMTRDVVISTLVRPRDLKLGFSLALRMQPNGSGFLLTTNEKTVRLTEGGRDIVNTSARRINPNAWCWYEVGMKTRKKEVILRVRVFDESRSKLLATL